MLDYVKQVIGVRSDARLCEKLNVAKATVSKIRHRKLMVGANLLLAIHEATEIPIKKLKQLMGDQRKTGGYR